MKRLVEFPTAGGGAVFVEVEGPDVLGGETRRGLFPSAAVMERAQTSFGRDPR